MLVGAICFLYRVLPFPVFCRFPNHLILLRILRLKRLNTPSTLLSLPQSNNLENLVGCVCVPGMVVSNVLEYRLSVGETNSARPGFIVWGAREALASPRRCAQCRPRYGCHSVRKGHSLASRRGRTRKNPDPRTLRLSSEETPR